MRRVLSATAFCAALTGCGGGNSQSSEPPPPPPPPPATFTSFDVDPCLTQNVLAGRTVAILVIPDTLTLDPTRPSVFPNGRALSDPVIDYTLAMLFLDLSREPIDALHRIPLNPPANDRPFRAGFPHLAPPQGNPPLAGSGQDFQFRTDPASSYVRVERMGMPAVATALIPGAQRNEYNDDSPAEDLTPREDQTFKWVPSLRNSLIDLTIVLEDDFNQAGLQMCAEPK